MKTIAYKKYLFNADTRRLHADKRRYFICDHLRYIYENLRSRNAFQNSIKGQGMLETALAVIISVLLLGGIFNIWLWANNQIVKRQLRYNESRVAAGTSSDTYTLQWPVYTPEELNEDKVLLDAP